MKMRLILCLFALSFSFAYANFDNYEQFASSMKKYSQEIKCKNNLCGVVNQDGKTIIDYKYEDLHYMKKDILSKYSFKQNGKWGVINEKNEILIEPKYDEISPSKKNGIYEVKVNNKIGLIDTDCKEILKPEFDYIYTFYKYIFAQNRDCADLYTFDGKKAVSLPSSFYGVSDIADIGKDNAFVVGYGGNGNGIFDLNGKVIIPPKYNSINFEHDFIVVELDNKYGIYDKSGNMIFDAKYDSYDANYTFAYVYDSKGREYSYSIDKTETPPPTKISKKEKRELKKRYKNLLHVKPVGEKYAVVNEYEKIKIKPQYDFMQKCGVNLFIASKDNKYGIIDAKNKVVLPFEYDFLCFNYYTEKMIYKKDGHYGLLDKDYKVIFDVVCDNMYLLSVDADSHFYVIKKEGKYGLVDVNGKYLYQCIYDDINLLIKTDCLKNYLKIKIGKKYIVADKNAKELLNLECEDVYSNDKLDFFIVKNKNGFMAYSFNNTPVQDYVFSGFKYIKRRGKVVAIFNKKNKIGLLDSDGKLILKPEYDDLFLSSYEYVYTKKGDKYGVYDMITKKLYNPEYDYIEEISELVNKKEGISKIGLLLYKNGVKTEVAH